MHDWRLPEQVRRKYEQAERFGLTDKLAEHGWGGLSARDAGRIGGAMRSRGCSTPTRARAASARWHSSPTDLR